MLKRVVLLALLASMMGTVSSLAADLKPTDKRTYELQQQISYNVIIPSEAFKTSADGTLIVPVELRPMIRAILWPLKRDLIIGN